jgi:hypothetical protein
MVAFTLPWSQLRSRVKQRSSNFDQLYGARPALCAQKRKINVISLAMACPFSRAGSNSQN